MSERHIFRDVASFEQRLSLPKDFYVRLLREDDWSFVIKLNALFEAVCAHALTTRLNAPELIDQFARLELADRERGKVKFLSTLGCITDEQAKFLRELASLRNTLAHNVSQVTFTFDEYVSGLDSNQRKKLAVVFAHGCNDPIPVAGKKIPLAKFAAENTKLVIWLTAAEVLACLYLEYEVAEIRLRTAALDEYRRIVLEPRIEALDRERVK
jgi:hypothetical protein